MLRKQNVSEYDLESETFVDHPQISEEKTRSETAHTIILAQPTLSSITGEDDCSTRIVTKNRTTKQGPNTKHHSNLIEKISVLIRVQYILYTVNEPHTSNKCIPCTFSKLFGGGILSALKLKIILQVEIILPCIVHTASLP